MKKREIKFRLRIGNRIVGYERIKPDEDGYLISTYSFDNSIGGWLFEPIKHKNKDEFISLKDKNKKEIYEGDIINLVNDAGKSINVTCEFGNARRRIFENIVDITGFYFKLPNGKKTFPIVNNYCGKHDLELFEIIGNIYENPELLKKEE